MNRRDEEVPDDQLPDMSRDDLVDLGTRLDRVEIVEYPEPWPVKGTRAEKRAQRAVVVWFAVSALAGLGFVAVYLFWPWRYQAPGTDGYFPYSLFTPMLGVTFGLAVTALAVGVLLYTKKFIPHEVAVQQRHDGGSSGVDRATVVAELSDAGERSTISRRPLVKTAISAGAGALGLGVGVFAIGGFVRDPWDEPESPESLWHTGWKSSAGERVFLRRSTGHPEEVVLVGPGDLATGGMETVFPFRESERYDEHALAAALKRSDSPVMLIRLRPQDGDEVVARAGQEDFNFGDYYAFSKICTHLGCPASLYEQRTNRILCPCHQSQFSVLMFAKPIFGPATRPLPQLPIAVDEETGYFYARSDFVEPVGPAFWELDA